MRRKMFGVILLIVVAAWGYFKFSSVDPIKFHVDPATAATPSRPGFYRETVTLEASAKDVAVQLDTIILSTPHTTHLAGDLTRDYASYVTRSAVWGFADIASIRITPTGDESSELTIFSRLRHGYSDVGVNKTRVKNWLSQLSNP
jgi:uncharacterized protein (DUF1499 family)